MRAWWDTLVTKTLDLLRDASLATLLFVGFAICAAASIFLIAVDYAGIKDALIRLGGKDEPLGYDAAFAWLAERTVLDLTQFSEPSLRAWSIAIGAELGVLIATFFLLETVKQSREFAICVGNYRSDRPNWRATLIHRATMLPLWIVATAVLGYVAYRLAVYNASLLVYRYLEEFLWARNPELDTPPAVPKDYLTQFASDYLTILIAGVAWAYYGIVVFSSVALKALYTLLANRMIPLGRSFRAWVYALFAVRSAAEPESPTVPVEMQTEPQRREAPVENRQPPAFEPNEPETRETPATEPRTDVDRRRFNFRRLRNPPPVAAPTDASVQKAKKNEEPLRYRVLLSSDPVETVTLEEARGNPERFYVDENEPLRVYDRVGWERLFRESDD